MQVAGKDILFQQKQDQFDLFLPNRDLIGQFQSNNQLFDQRTHDLFRQLQSNRDKYAHSTGDGFEQPNSVLLDEAQSNQHLFNQKKQILLNLKKEILLQHFGNPKNNRLAAPSLYPFASAFPFHQFPLGCVHEFICPTNESLSASSAFVCGILSSVKQNKGPIIWISSSQKMFPPSFTSFGIAPHNIIFINPTKPKDLLYSTEEALRCKDISAVITDIRDLNFKQSRRLQLATEQSRVTGFVLRNKPKTINTTACVSRWMITPTISTSYENLPGICFPTWNVDLQKVRNGKPQSWKITWLAGHFVHEQDLTTSIIHHKKAV